MKLCIVQLLLVWVSVATASFCDGGIDRYDRVFTVTPKPLPAQPLGSQFTLNCSSLMAAECFPSHVQWFLWVDPTGDGYGYVSNSKYLLPPGMTAVHSTGFTQLHITATRTTNRTLIVCRILAPNYNCASRQIQLVYYGPPSTPTDPTATENGPGSLNISWSLATMEGVGVEFTLTATNLKDPNSSPIVVSRIAYQYLVLTIEYSTSCDVYSFQVTARNGAGSNTSESITRSFPSLPVLSSVEHSVVNNMLNIHIGATACPDYPVLRYFLVLKRRLGDYVRIPLAAADGGVTVEMAVKENWYSFHAEVTNAAGKVQSVSAELKSALATEKSK